MEEEDDEGVDVGLAESLERAQEALVETNQISDTNFRLVYNRLIDASKLNFLVWLHFMWPQQESQTYIIGKLHSYLARLVQAVFDGERNPRQSVSVPPQHGKALEDSTLIPTTKGMKPIGSLQVGDEVFAPDGTPTKVVATRSWKSRPCYRLTFDDGSSVIADEEHEWDVSLCRKRRSVFTTHTTRALANRSSKRAPMLPAVRPVEYSEKTQPIPAYILGCWLGDGSKGRNEFTASEEDQPHYFARFEALGFTTKRSRTVPTRFSLTNASWFSAWLRAWRLSTHKHIPEHYLRGSVEQRRELLRGLIDTDGYVAPDGQVEFCNTNETLARDTLQLVHSLGIKASLIEGRATLNGKDCGAKWRVMFYADGVASLPRKATRTREPKKSCRYIERVERCEDADTTCIEVDHPSHLFLAGECYVPTHNSRILAVRAVAWLIGKQPGINIALTGFSPTLLNDFLREVKAIVASPQYQEIFSDIEPEAGYNRNNAVMYSNGSSVQCRSCNSKLTGRPVDWLIIDDPHPGRKEAESPTQRKDVENWYFGDCRSRLSEDAKVFIISTRWHPEDLHGVLTDPERVQRLEEEGVGDVNFEVTNLTAVCEDEESDPLGREEGEAIFPEQKSAEFLRQTKAEIPSYEWESQYMGRPVSISSGLIDAGQIVIIQKRNIPWDELTMIARGWDLATTEQTASDNSAGVLMGYNENTKDVYVLNVWKKKGIWPKIKAKAIQLAYSDLADYGVARIGVEGVAGFRACVQDLRAELQGDVRVELSNPKAGGKLLRALPWLNKMEKGKFYVVQDDWTADYIHELSVFPDGKYHDDQVDGTSIAYEIVTKPPAKILIA